MIEGGSVPVGVADFITRTRGHQELVGAIGFVGERVAKSMEEEREASLEPTRHIRAFALPRPPLRERSDSRQPIAIGQLLQQQVGQRCRRFADGKSGMAPTFDHDDSTACLAKTQSSQRSGKPGSDNGDVGVDVFAGR
jgi:hypothetical protein